MGVGGIARTGPHEKVQELGTRQSARMGVCSGCSTAGIPSGQRTNFGEPLPQAALVNAARTAVGVKELAPDVPQLRCSVATLDGPDEYDDNALLEV